MDSKGQKVGGAMDLENVVLKCTTCGAQEAATVANYMGMIKSSKHKKHAIRFVDRTTGDVLAVSLPEAQEKGLVPKKSDEKAAAGVEGFEFTDDGDFLIPMMVSIPSSALAHFYKAKKGKLTDQSNIIEFLWEWAQIGFVKETGYGLTLAPMEVSGSTGEEELKKLVENLPESIAQATAKAVAAALASIYPPAEAKAKGG
jgi:hypothetical protein